MNDVEGGMRFAYDHLRDVKEPPGVKIGAFQRLKQIALCNGYQYDSFADWFELLKEPITYHVIRSSDFSYELT